MTRQEFVGVHSIIRRRMRVLILAIVLTVSSPAVVVFTGQAPHPIARRTSVSAEQRVAQQFERIRQDPPALRAFLQAMPKGADLHNHLSGAVYAESYIAWAAEMPLCIDIATSRYVESKSTSASSANCSDGQRPASDALQDPALYRKLIDAFSTRFWHPAKAAGHYQFFDTFLNFGNAIREGRRASEQIVAKSVAEVAQRAALQNVHYIELMMSFGSATEESLRLDVAAGTDDAFNRARNELLTHGLRERVADRRKWLDRVEDARRALQHCGTADEMRACNMTVRYMPYALRGFPPDEVFSQALFAFDLAAADLRIAGVNLVMPEDWFVPMRDYDLHMRMYAFLRRQYPNVNVALHAGELALGLVPPEKLGTHVRQAVSIAGAQRVGHATDIMYDTEPDALLRVMARRRIAVEISLSSSDIILGLRGPRHPLRQFLRAGVPVVIASDDEGVARSDLTNEYQRAVEEHGLGYREVKQISLNSIEYSFLPTEERTRMMTRLKSAFSAFEARRP